MSHEASADYRRKILSSSELGAVVEAAREHGKSIVHCHGCFDILHPGHIRHLAWARQQGDVLIVSVTADAFVNKGPGRPFIPEELRAENLAALEMVDHVTISHDHTGARLLELVRPDFYVKGKEAETDQSEGMRREREVVERFGGRILYSSGEVMFSSTSLGAHGAADLDLSSELVEVFCRRHGVTLAGLLDTVKSFAGRPVLLVGEAMLEEEVSCEAVGLARGATSLELRELTRERRLAGVPRVARWVSALGGRPRVVALAGSDATADSVEQALRSVAAEYALVRDDTRPTAVRQAYRCREGPVMRVLRASMTGMPSAVSKLALAKTRELIEDCDAVLAMDLGCGMWAPEWRQTFVPAAREAKGPFVGTTSVPGEVAPIERIQGTDVTVLAERQVRVALQDADGSVEELGRRAMQRLECRQLVLRHDEDSLFLFTRGGEADDQDVVLDFLPALTPAQGRSEQDELAALATLVLSLATGASLHQAAFLSSTARGLSRAHLQPGEALSEALEEHLRYVWTQHFEADADRDHGK